MICFHINSLQFWQERVTCFWDKKGSLNMKVWTEVLKVRLEPGMSMVLFSRSVVSDSLQAQEEQHARPPCPSPSPRACSNSRLSSRWCHVTISSSVIPFSSCLQSFPASGFFLMSQFFTSSGQRVRASASVFSVDIQDWFPFGLTGLFMSKCLINYRLYF